MTTQEEHDDAGTLSVKDMQSWLAQEVKDSAKAHELRVRDAQQLVDEYASGKITPQQAMDGLYSYDRRWGEALCGASALDGQSDEMILAAVDRARSSGVRAVDRVSRQRPEPGSRGRG